MPNGHEVLIDTDQSIGYQRPTASIRIILGLLTTFLLPRKPGTSHCCCCYFPLFLPIAETYDIWSTAHNILVWPMSTPFPSMTAAEPCALRIIDGTQNGFWLLLKHVGEIVFHRVVIVVTVITTVVTVITTVITTVIVVVFVTFSSSFSPFSLYVGNALSPGNGPYIPLRPYLHRPSDSAYPSPSTVQSMAVHKLFEEGVDPPLATLDGELNRVSNRKTPKGEARIMRKTTRKTKTSSATNTTVKELTKTTTTTEFRGRRRRRPSQEVLQPPDGNSLGMPPRVQGTQPHKQQSPDQATLIWEGGRLSQRHSRHRAPLARNKAKRKATKPDAGLVLIIIIITLYLTPFSILIINQLAQYGGAEVLCLHDILLSILGFSQLAQYGGVEVLCLYIILLSILSQLAHQLAQYGGVEVLCQHNILSKSKPLQPITLGASAYLLRDSESLAAATSGLLIARDEVGELSSGLQYADESDSLEDLIDDMWEVRNVRETAHDDPSHLRHSHRSPLMITLQGTFDEPTKAKANANANAKESLVKKSVARPREGGRFSTKPRSSTCAAMLTIALPNHDTPPCRGPPKSLEGIGGRSLQGARTRTVMMRGRWEDEEDGKWWIHFRSSWTWNSLDQRTPKARGPTTIGGGEVVWYKRGRAEKAEASPEEVKEAGEG
ncbi:hypothetical protein M426DRAFT_26115 [Hypoxylon sp. CI-4A]|nr:hypothetical protein M426DRAFT_26115 [Hypoxylon sp. CI-4A]